MDHPGNAGSLSGGDCDRLRSTELREHARKRFPFRETVGLVFARGLPQLNDGLGNFDGAYYPIKDRDVQIGLKLLGELGKARAAQQDRFRVIFVFGLPR